MADLVIHSSRRSHLFVLALYTLLALVMTYPLALHFSSAVPGIEGDLWSYVWTFGWAKMAFTLGANPLHSNYIFYPLGGATQFFWAISLIAVISIPLQNLLGLLPAYNLLYLAATIFTAYGTFLLANEISGKRGRTLVANKLAAFVAGLVLAFGALRQGYGLAFFNLYNTELIPFYALFLIRSLRSPAKWNPILAGILLGLNAYLDFQLVTLLALFTLLFLVASFRSLLTREKIFRQALLGLVALGVMAPMLLAVQKEFAVEGGDYIRVFPLRYSNARAYDLLSYVIPNAGSTLYQIIPSVHVAGVNAAVSVEGESQLSPDLQAFVGYTTLALVLCALVWNRKRARPWAFVAFAYALFSFGPSLHVWGIDTGLPLPFLALHDIPIIDHIRVPMRYGLFVLFPVAILAGIGLDELMKRIKRVNADGKISPTPSIRAWLIPIGISILILSESAVLPFPFQIFSPSAFYQRLANEPGDFTILEIPSYDWRDAARAEAYQTIHHKRILRAYTNRIAPDIADYFSLRQTPVLIRSLRILEGAEQGSLTADELAEDRVNLGAILNFYDLKYAVVHHDRLTPEQDAALRLYLQDVLQARQVESEAQATLYAFDLAPARNSALTIDTATNIALMYLGRGWQTEPQAQIDGVSARYFNGTSAEIYFPGDGNTRTMTLRAVCENSETRVALQLNDRSLLPLTLSTAWQNFAFALPPDTVIAGMNHLILRFDSLQNQNCAVAEIIVK